MDVSIIVPVYNEEAFVVEAVRRALAVDLGVGSREVVVVDDGSTDRSMELLRAAGYGEDEVRIVELGANHGKGYAVRAGAEHAVGTYLAVLDADFEYDAEDYAKMIPPIRDDGMDACIGTRMFAAHSAYGFWYVMGNRVINTICNVLFNSWLSDFGAGPKVVPAATFRSLDLRENGFGFDAELVSRLLKAGKRIYEVPVFYKARNREEGKKITTRDGVRILGVFLRVRLR